MMTAFISRPVQPLRPIPGLPGLTCTLQPKIHPSALGMSAPKPLQALASVSTRKARAKGMEKMACLTNNARYLTSLERFFFEVSTLGHNEANTGYRLKLTKPLPALHVVQGSLARLQESIPGLRYCICNKQRRQHKFVAMASSKKLVFERRTLAHESDWHNDLSQILQEHFDPTTSPLVRFICLQNSQKVDCELLAIAHHSLIDGQGMLFILQKLLAEVYQPAATDCQAAGRAHSGAAQDIARAPIYRYKPPGYRSLMKMIAANVCAKLSMLSRPKIQPSSRTQITSLQFDAVYSSQLVMHAKNQGASVYGVVAAAALLAARSYFQATPVGHPLSVATAVSLRSRLNTLVDAGELGCLVAPVRDSFLLPKYAADQAKGFKSHDFWRLARQAQASVAQSLAEQQHEATPFLIDLFFKCGGSIGLLSKVITQDTLMLNNLGKQALSPADVTQFSWVTSLGALASGVNINFLSCNDELQMSLFSRHLSQQELQAFTQQLEQYLHETIAPTSVAPTSVL